MIELYISRLVKCYESPMYQFLLKNRRHVVESSNVPFTIMVIQSGSLLESSELVGIC